MIGNSVSREQIEVLGKGIHEHSGHESGFGNEENYLTILILLHCMVLGYIGTGRDSVTTGELAGLCLGAGGFSCSCV